MLAACAGAGSAEPAYDYPLADPLAATVVGTPAEFRAPLPTTVPFDTRYLEPLVERATPATLGYARPLRYGLAAQQGPAPLVFVIAGTGADYGSGDNRLLARIFHDAGLHAVTLPSPTAVTFILGAAEHPVPGRMPADVAALDAVIRAVTEQLPDDLEITDYRLAGYSLGATQAAFLAHRREIGDGPRFERVLLINPAVDTYQSVRRLDALLLEGLPNGIAGLPVFLEQAIAQLKRVYGGNDPLRFDTDVLYRAYRKARPGQINLAGIVGLAFRLSLANMAFAADLITDSGVIVAPGADPGIGDSLEPYLIRALGLSFDAYIERLLLPYYRRREPTLTRQDLIAEANLRRLDAFLADSPHIAVFSNEHEPILDDAELAFLRRTFGERAFIYPRGGHLGNIGQHQTVRDMRNFIIGDTP